jgi:hypothetical protein
VVERQDSSQLRARVGDRPRYPEGMLKSLRRLFRRHPETSEEREDHAASESERLQTQADAQRYAGGTSIQGRGGGMGRGY